MFESFVYPAIFGGLGLGVILLVDVIITRLRAKKDTHPMGERPSWLDRNGQPRTLVRQDIEPEPIRVRPIPPRPLEEDDCAPSGPFTCFFCAEVYDTDDVSDYWCYGCERYICLLCTDIDNDPCGPHTADDHPAWELKRGMRQ